jgi:HAD superfamily hydrolase (TIGR01450 family)
MAVGGVLFDIDGVLVTSWKPIEGAADSLRVLADNQIARSYLTNTTTRTREQIARLLSDAGIEVSADEVITAAALTAEYVRGQYPDARCFLVNSGQIAQDMPGIDIVYAGDYGADDPAPDTPDVILLGGAGPEYDHLTLSRVYDWMAQGVPVVAMHRSTSWNTTEGLRVDTGMYLIGMEETSGRKATAVGKPAPAGFLAAASRLGVDPDEMYMIGDDLNNDVEFWCAPASSVRTPSTGGPPTSSRCNPTTSSTRSPTCRISWACSGHALRPAELRLHGRSRRGCRCRQYRSP